MSWERARTVSPSKNCVAIESRRNRGPVAGEAQSRSLDVVPPLRAVKVVKPLPKAEPVSTVFASG